MSSLQVATLTIMLTSAHIATAGQFIDLGIPVKQAGLRARMAGPDADGNRTMVYLSFNQPAGLFLVQIDPNTGEVNQYNSEVSTGASGMIDGPDGKVYLGTGHGAHFLRFDPAKPEEGLVDLGQATDTELLIWLMTVGKDDGMVYACTYPHAKLLACDTATGELKDLGSMSETQKYARYIATGQNGMIYVSVGTVQYDIVAYDPKTGEHHSALPEDIRAEIWEQGAGITVFNGNDGGAWAMALDYIFHLIDGQAVVVPQRSGFLNKPMDDGRLLVNADISGAYTLLDTKTKEKTVHEFEYEGAGSGVFVLDVGPDGRIYGGTVLPLLLFVHDPETAEHEILGNPSDLKDGEIYSMLSRGDKLWTCAYGGSYLSVYDPSKPWDFGTDEGKNPRGFGKLGDGHLRPTALIHGPDDTIYIGSLAHYGQHGGAMGVFDPENWELVENYRHIIQDQGVASLAYDPESGLVFGGGDIAGGGGTDPIVEAPSFFVWDPVKKEKIDELVPCTKDKMIVGMAVANGKVFMTGRWSASLSIYDIAERKLLETRKIEYGTPMWGSIERHTDGYVYALTHTSIIRIDPETHEITEVARAPEGTGVGFAVTERGVYFGKGTHIWVYEW